METVTMTCTDFAADLAAAFDKVGVAGAVLMLFVLFAGFWFGYLIGYRSPA